MFSHVKPFFIDVNDVVRAFRHGIMWSTFDKQNSNLNLLFSSFNYGFMAFEQRNITPDLTSLNSEVGFVFNAKAKDRTLVL